MAEIRDKYRKYIDKECNYMAWYNFFYHTFYVPLKIFFPGKALGLEHLPQSGGYILAFNHRSAKDVPLSFLAVPKYRHFVAKEEHYNSAFCRWLFPKLGVVAVNREKPDLSTIRKVVKILNRGEVVGLFPEGTRNRDEDADMLQFKNGTALFALQAKVPVVPVYIYRKPKFFRKNYVYVGPPIYPPEGRISADTIASFGGAVRDALESAKTYLGGIMAAGTYRNEFKLEKKRIKAAKRAAKAAAKAEKRARKSGGDAPREKN